MKKYKGNYVMTITAQDVADFKARKMNAAKYFKLKDAMGNLLPLDIGKQVFEINGIYQVENDEQLKNRLSK
jgi:hypothetical protein